MQEAEEKDNLNLSVEDQFLNYQESFEEAQARAAEENKSFVKMEHFRMEKTGTYTFRILPLAPPKGNEEPRKGYEYPVHQMLLKIARPGKTGKKAFAFANVVRANYAGYKSDLIDTYRKLAIAEAKNLGEKELSEKIGSDSFSGGIKFGFGHAVYVYDKDERKKGVQLLTLSHSQFKELEERKLNIWKKLLSNDPKHPCPISSFKNAYPVEIEKKKQGQKTEYVINIDTLSGCDVLTSEELKSLLAAPRIPETIYRYTRYHFEATMAFLKQCDEVYSLAIMESDEMKEAIASFESEIPSDDTSSFTLDKDDKDGEGDTQSGAHTFDSLAAKYDDLCNAGIGDKTEAGQEFRVMLNEFIAQENLNVKPNRRSTNLDILDEIEKVLEERGKLGNANSTTVDDEGQGDEPTETHDEDQAPVARASRSSRVRA